jgi:hypothetical protein
MGILEKSDWLPEFIHEVTTFQNAKYNDQVDSTSQALDWIKHHYIDQEFGLLTVFRREVTCLGLPCPLPTIVADAALVSRGADQAIPAVKFGPAVSGSCPECRSTCVAFCSGQLRCNQCGHIGSPDRKVPEVAHITRGDFLSSRIGLGPRYLRFGRWGVMADFCSALLASLICDLRQRQPSAIVSFPNRGI